MDYLSPVLTSAQIKKCDAYTIENEPISSFDLMERASWVLARKIQSIIAPKAKVHILCGPGNNGGDGFCIGRILLAFGYKIRITDCAFGKQHSIENLFAQKLWAVKQHNDISRPEKAADVILDSDEIIVDCILGTGLTNGLSGQFKELIDLLNAKSNFTLSVDIPTGLFDQSKQGENAYLKANKTLSIQTSKPSFFYAENEIDFEIVDAGINISTVQSGIHYIHPLNNESVLPKMVPSKRKFSHKGTYGHAVLVGGNKGMAGAIAIAAKSCVQSGAGKTTVLAPAAAKFHLGNIPEAMHTNTRFHKTTEMVPLPKDITVLCIGPGLGTDSDVLDFFTQILNQYTGPVLLDADALNLISKHPELWKMVAKGSVITPHPGEFNRLFGATHSGEEKFKLGREKAMELGIYILAKDTYSALYCPDGNVIYNGTGGGWLAQGGSGDKLAGIIAAYWSRTGCAKTACMAGMYAAGLQNFNLSNI